MNFWLAIIVTAVMLLAVEYIFFKTIRQRVQSRRWRRPWLFTLLSYFLLLLVSIFIFNGIFQPFALNCATPPLSGQYKCQQGTIKVGGSTALKPLLKVATSNYASKCPGASLTVLDEHSNPKMAGSFDGLDGVINGDVQIGSSDIFMSDHNPKQAEYYSDYQIAAVIYVVIVNKSAGMPGNISVDDLKKIYTSNTPLKWGQFGGPATTTVVPFIREDSSGTERTFEDYITNHEQLNVPENHRYKEPGAIIHAIATTPGAIGFVSLGDIDIQTDPSIQADILKIQMLNIGEVPAQAKNIEDGSYPFWNIEHLYISKENPSDLAVSFINFLGSKEGKAAIGGHDYVMLNEISANALNSRCPQSRS